MPPGIPDRSTGKRSRRGCLLGKPLRHASTVLSQARNGSHFGLQFVQAAPIDDVSG